ncbi:MAG: DUF2147 domain-containing protein [Paracoccaceae bacterium]
MIRVFIAAVLLALVPAIHDAAAQAKDGVTGFWLTEKKGVIVDIYKCGEGDLCGRTVWLKKPYNKDGSLRVDTENPDPALRDRPWCGIEVISGLIPEGEGKWTGGSVYDPKTGLTFDFDLKLTDSGLKARGYLGVPLLGKTEDWTRAQPEEVSLCPEI